MPNEIIRRDALALGVSAAALAVTGANGQTSNIKAADVQPISNLCPDGLPGRKPMHDQVTTNQARTNLAPIPMECDAPHLKITGELPRELNGTLYRNGPNPQFDAPGAHWFVGDGMLHAFHLENGRASYRNRWVRTPQRLAEHDAGRALFGGFGRKLPGAPAGITDDCGVANTNIIFHAGKLL